MTFEQIVGHCEIKQRLLSAVSTGKVSHAYIFSGKRGVGKNSMALAFADALTSGSAVDVTVVTNELYDTQSKSDAVSVKAVRGAAADMYKKPYASDRRVFIFPEAEKMTPQAQNALLKVFEEPPSYCVIILVTQNDRMLLQTIRSRAVTIRFFELADSDVASMMPQHERQEIIVRLAAGSIGAANELCENEELGGILDSFVALFKKIGSAKAADIYSLINYIQKEKKNSEVLFDVMLVMLRDTMLGKEGGLKIDGVSCKKAASLAGIVERAKNSFSYNANFNLVVGEMMLDILGAVND